MSHESTDVPTGHPDRFWHGTPNKNAAKPLMIELRHKWAATQEANPRYSRLIGYGTCAADEQSVADEKRRILKVAGDLDKYLGVHA